MGHAGAQGIQGIQGNVGSIGPIGATGPVGPVGPTGSVGPPGPTGPQGVGIIASYITDNGATTYTLTTPSGVQILTIPGVVVGAGQKVIISFSMNYGCFSGGSPIEIYHFLYQGGTPIDEIQDFYVPNSTLGASPSYRTITRTVTLVPGAGTYTFAVLASVNSGTTAVLNASSPPFVGAGQMWLQVLP
jgi:hypothetical protein